MNISNLKKQLKSYFTSIISVYISVVSLCVVSVISMAGKDAIQKELDGIGMNGMSVTIYNAAGENITDETVYNALSENTEVTRLTPVMYQIATVQFDNSEEMQCVCWGISPMAKDIVNLTQLCGRGLFNSDITNNSMVCMIDENIALNSYGRSNITGKNMYITLDGGANCFEIIGTVNKTSSVLNGMSGSTIPDFIYIPYTTMKYLSNTKSFQQIMINVSSDNVTEDSIKKYISSNVKLAPNALISITNLSRQRESINKIVNIAFLALFAVSCVAIIVCGISVATSVNAAVSNSRHDIGIKISLGASKIDIMTEFLVLSVIACILGIISGMFTGIIVLMIFNIFLQSAFYFDSQLIIYGISVTILLAVVFSLYPSYKAASLIPIKALSRE